MFCEIAKIDAHSAKVDDSRAVLRRGAPPSRLSMDRLRDPAHPFKIASSLVSPGSFLFHSKPKQGPSAPIPQVMDKSQQPSSFQQLEKVCPCLYLPVSPH
jgi:hypothetical protein